MSPCHSPEGTLTQTRGKYTLGALLGQGGMGAVYRSHHPLLNRPIAIKVMLANIAADPQAHQRFLREAQVVAVLRTPISSISSMWMSRMVSHIL